MDRIGQINSSDLFVRLCKALFAAEYSDFESVDDSGGDAGNDGYSPSKKTLFQLYCPEKPEKADDATYKTKIKEDLDKAKKLRDSGKYVIEDWIFVTPRDLRENVHTYLREEAVLRGFNGIAWSEPKLTELLARHYHLRSQFPDLILPDLERKLDEKVISRLDTKEELEKKYRTKTEQAYKKRIDEARDILNSGKHESAKKEYERIITDLEAETEEVDRHLFFRAYNNLGSAELDSYNSEKAAELFEKAYANAPNDPKAITNFALAKGLKSDPEEGLKIIDELIEKHPNDEHVISVKINLLMMANREEELFSFLKEKGKVALAHFHEGLKLLKQKDYDLAAISFEKGYRLDNKNVTSLLYAVQCVMVGSQDINGGNFFPDRKPPKDIQTKFQKAIDWLKTAIAALEKTENKKDLEMAYTNLSGCYVALGLSEESIDSAQKAILLDPMSAMPYFNKGIAELKLDRYKEASDDLKKFKDLGGDMPDLEVHIAFCLLQLGDLDEVEKIIVPKLDQNPLELGIAEIGIELYTRRLNDSRLNTLLKRLEDEFHDDPVAIRLRYKYLRKIGDESAEDLLQKAAERVENPGDKAQIEFDLASFFLDKKEYTKALEIYEKYINAKEESPANRRYAECLYNLGQYGKLIKWIETLDDTLKRDFYIKELGAYSNLNQDKLEKASELFKELFENRPNQLKYLAYYGMCRVRLGKESEAKQAYDLVKNRVTDPEDLITLAGGYELIDERNLAVELTYKALVADLNNPRTHKAYISAFLKREQAEGSEFEEKYIKAFQKSIAEFTQRFPEEKVFKQFEVKDNDISEILKVTDQIAEVADTASNLYKESKFPIAYVAKYTGKKPLDVWAAFTSMPDVGIKMLFGSHDEIEGENSIFEKHNGKAIVSDIYPLFLLGHLDCLNLLTQSFEKVYFHQSVLDAINDQIDNDKVSAEKGITTLGKIGGQHRILEISPDQVKKTLQLLQKIKDFIVNDPKCHIAGLTIDSSPLETEFIDNLDMATKNSVLLAQELNLPFYCDDRVLRAVLKSNCKMLVFSSYSLIDLSEKNKIISIDQKADIHKELVDLNYDFMPISGGFVYRHLKKENYGVEKIIKIISNLSKKETNIDSLGTVVTDLVFLTLRDSNIADNQKISILQEILSEIKKNHNIDEIKAMVFGNFEKRIAPEKIEFFRKVIDVIFNN